MRHDQMPTADSMQDSLLTSIDNYPQQLKSFRLRTINQAIGALKALRRGDDDLGALIKDLATVRNDLERDEA